jgi:hypothetical protein
MSSGHPTEMTQLFEELRDAVALAGTQQVIREPGAHGHVIIRDYV